MGYTAEMIFNPSHSNNRLHRWGKEKKQGEKVMVIKWTPLFYSGKLQSFQYIWIENKLGLQIKIQKIKIMRNLYTLLLITIAFHSFAQTTKLGNPEAKKSIITFNGNSYNGYFIEFNANQQIVGDAIKEQFKLQGIKPTETKGFLVYRNLVMPAIDPKTAMDAFVKVERKSRNEREQTVVYFIAALAAEIPEEKVKQNIASKTSITIVKKADEFLTGLIPDITQRLYNIDIANHQIQVQKEEKKLASILLNQLELEKKLKNLKIDMEYNKNAGERQTIEVEKAKVILDALIANNPSKEK